MSGLARLLAGHTAPGVYRWDSPSGIHEIEHTTVHAGWDFRLLDTVALESQAEFLSACQLSLSLPPWASDSFDRLGDALADLGPGDRVGVLVLWDGWGPLARADRQAFDLGLSILTERADTQAGTFSVVLHGPGPDDVDVPDLDPH